MQSAREMSQSSTENSGETESETCDNPSAVSSDPVLFFTKKGGYSFFLCANGSVLLLAQIVCWTTRWQFGAASLGRPRVSDLWSSIVVSDRKHGHSHSSCYTCSAVVLVQLQSQ